MNKKLTRQEIGRVGGKKRWAKVSKEERSKFARDNANKLWAKIKSGGLTSQA